MTHERIGRDQAMNCKKQAARTVSPLTTHNSLFQILHLNIPKVYWLAFALKCDVAGSQRCAWPPNCTVITLHNTASHGRLAVLQHRISFNNVSNERITEHDQLRF